MKTITRILSSISLALVLAYSAQAQDVFKGAPVGIGSVTPTQALDVAGSVKFSGALMPGGVAGTAGNILMSAGGGATTTWFTNGSSGQALHSNGSGAPSWAAYGYWSLTGNVGTVSGINFVGTTDDKQLRFENDGAYAGSIDPLLVGATTYGNTYLGGYAANNEVGGAGGPDGGTYNVAIGLGSLAGETGGGYAANSGTNNVSLGSLSNPINSTGSNNISIGFEVLRYNNTGSGNVAIGGTDNGSYNGDMSGNVSANYNTAVGTEAMASLASGTNGPYSGNTNGNYNTALGASALALQYGYNGVSFPASNTAIGSSAAYNTTGNRNVAVGDSALCSNAAGINNTALGYQANVASSTLTNAIAIGYKAAAPVSNSIALGNSSVTALYLPGYTSTGSLFYTSANTGLVANLAPGTSGYMLKSNGTGVPTWSNVSLGGGTVTSISGNAPITINGTWVVGIQGESSGLDKGGVLYSTGPGTSAFFTPTGSAGQILTSNGTGAPTWAGTNTWNLTGNAITAPYGTDFVGTTSNVPLEFKSVSDEVGVLDPLYDNVYFGYNVHPTGPDATSIVSAIGNIALGANSFYGAVSGTNYNVVLGVATLKSYNYSNSNNGSVAVGDYALTNATANASFTGVVNTAFGYQYPGQGNTIGTHNISIGEFAAYTNTTGNSNVALGDSALYSFSAANNNTALGTSSLRAASSGANNTAIGRNAGDGNTMGSGNTSVGDDALNANTTGSDNTALGYNANVASATLSNAMAIGYNASVPASNSITLGNTAVTSLYLPGYNSVNSLLYTSATSGLVAATGAGTSGYLLQSNGAGVVPTWANISISGGGGTVSLVTGTPPIVESGSWLLGIQGTNANEGGILYSTGSGNPAAFTLTGTANDIYQSGGTGIPTWATAASIYTGSVVWNLTGNAITASYGTDFVGTNNTSGNQPMEFKVAGHESGVLDPTYDNVFFGYNSGAAGPDGSSIVAAVGNVVLGGGSFTNAIAGDNYNVAIGQDALSATNYANSGNGSVAIGNYALHSATSTAAVTGVVNTSFGYNYSGQGNTTGTDNISFGQFAAHNNTTGNANVALGDSALYTASGASVSGHDNDNTAVGTSALRFTTTGSNSTAIGGNSLDANTTGSGNTSIGYDALSVNTTGSNNTGLGYGANMGTPSLGNGSAIGALAYNNQSNSMVLGSIKSTNGATANANVGIDTYTPDADAALAIKTGHLETQVGSASTTIAAGYSGVTSLSLAGTDVAGTASFTVPASGSTGAQATVTFASSYVYPPIVVLSPANNAAANAMTANQVYASSTSSTFSINFNAAASSSTAYHFNYFAIETPGVCYVPITLNNSTGSNTPSGYQQMISFASSTYASYEYSGLQNIEFTVGGPYGTGTALQAWIESNATNASTSGSPTVVWVNLGSSNPVPANGSLVIYMNFMQSNVLSSSGPTGEAPQLSSTYGQYDNGSSIFNIYSNFNTSGSSTSSYTGFTAHNNAVNEISFDNSCIINMTGKAAWNTYLVYSTAISPGTNGVVVESDMQQNPTASTGQAALVALIASTTNTLSNSSPYNAFAGEYQFPSSSSSNSFAFVYGYSSGGSPFPTIGTTTANTNFNIWSLGINSSGNLGFGDINYTSVATPVPNTHETLSSFYMGLQTTNYVATFYWIRTRIYPISGVAVSTPFGSVTCL